MMDTPNRRAFLKLLGAGALATLEAGCARTPARVPRGATASPAVGAAKHEGAAAPGPRRHVAILTLSGGYDPVLTFDPKDPADTRGTIDCQYTAAERVQGAKRLYGPLMGDLLRHEADMCILHGVRLDTVSHGEGLQMLMTGKHQYSVHDDSFAARLGGKMSGTAPCAHLTMLPGQPRSGPAIPTVESLAGDGPEMVLDAYAAEAIAAGRAQSFARAPWQGEVDEARKKQLPSVLASPGERGFYEWALGAEAELGRFLTSSAPQSGFHDPTLGASLEVAFNALRANYAKVVSVTAKALWFDSHTDNLRIQQQRVSSAFHDVARFIDLLKSTRDGDGTLYDHTTVLICSEIGRFPRLNGNLGKDHWPETSWALLGRGVAAGRTVGATATNLRGLPVNFASGRLEGDGLRPVFVDSVFATLSEIAGVGAVTAGYSADQAIPFAYAV